MGGLMAGELAPAGLAAELARRHEAVSAGLRNIGAACLVAVRDESVAYLAGYTSMTWKMHSRPIVSVVRADGRFHMLAAETEVDSIRLRVPGADVHTYVQLDPVSEDMCLPDGRIQFAPHAARVLAELIDDAGSGLIAVDGLDAVWPPVGQLTRLIPEARGRTVDASDIIWQARLKKSPWEVDRLKEAAAILERTYARLREWIRPGMTERRIGQLFSIAQLECGAHDVGAYGVVAGPDRGLFGFPTERVWDTDELLYVDGAPIVDGYWSDYCRTFAARPPRAAEREGYERARRGLTAAVASWEPGQTAGTMGRIMADSMDIAPHEVGFGRFGHGIGLHVPEPPSLHVGDPTVLESGFTICIEPAVVHQGINFVVEEEYLISDDGPVRLSPPAPEGILVV